ncbi:MAG TPA: hypothetical protein DCR17_16435 [Verrucomicrobiales bacterium]|nr:hypothetical protein [Verrucomicrobiales bacterium]
MVKHSFFEVTKAFTASRRNGTDKTFSLQELNNRRFDRFEQKAMNLVSGTMPQHACMLDFQKQP